MQAAVISLMNEDADTGLDGEDFMRFRNRVFCWGSFSPFGWADVKPYDTALEEGEIENRERSD